MRKFKEMEKNLKKKKPPKEVIVEEELEES